MEFICKVDLSAQTDAYQSVTNYAMAVYIKSHALEALLSGGRTEVWR